MNSTTSLLAMNYITISGLDIVSIKVHRLIPVFYATTTIIGIFPFIYMLVLVLYWVFVHRRFGLRIANRIMAWRNGYDEFEGRNNDDIDSIEHSRGYEPNSG